MSQIKCTEPVSVGEVCQNTTSFVEAIRYDDKTYVLRDVSYLPVSILALQTIYALKYQDGANTNLNF